MYCRILGNGLRVAGEDEPIATETNGPLSLGGSFAVQRRGVRLVSKRPTMVSLTTEEVNSLLRRFWEVKSLEILLTVDDRTDDPAMKRFEESASYDGLRYSVGLLWRPGQHGIGVESSEALKRRLNRDPRWG
ncbi:hypothetical protein T10_13621 [Trichinella papuae]|uniref:Uncharacterized protein n=1 Tax=Trichinella papuae TaxID=268474 RepID=A0A0V1MG37_9BILA|nr:hypothetical protein T10_13621 [Trichinella papuae]